MCVGFEKDTFKLLIKENKSMCVPLMDSVVFFSFKVPFGLEKRIESTFTLVPYSFRPFFSFHLEYYNLFYDVNHYGKLQFMQSTCFSINLQTIKHNKCSHCEPTALYIFLRVGKKKHCIN